MNGTRVSCEHHDDSGSYHEVVEDLGFNARMSLNTWIIRLRKGSLTWLVSHEGAPPRVLHHANATLTSPMSTRLILRTNFRNGNPGFLPTHFWDVANFSFYPHVATNDF